MLTKSLSSQMCVVEWDVSVVDGGYFGVMLIFLIVGGDIVYLKCTTSFRFSDEAFYFCISPQNGVLDGQKRGQNCMS